MLTVIHTISDIKFSGLMAVYRESNALNGSEFYGMLSESEQLRMAESDFYNYLNTVFFHQLNSFYAVWEDTGKYRSALRIEPYQDGYLLCALETAPADRGKGYAGHLLRGVLKHLAQQGSGILYSHVSKRNTASLSVHQKCGFQVVKDYAVYADGSVHWNNCTLACSYRKSETP